MKYKTPELPSNRTPDQWKWWKRCFEDGLRINKVDNDDDKLVHLRTYAGAEFFAILSTATTLAEGIATLDKQFARPTRVLYARHQLLSAKQNEDENFTAFFARLKRLVEQCECGELDVQQHKDALVRDALVSGLRSELIRARLLELDDSKASVDGCLSLACAIELSSDFSKSFKAHDTPVAAAATSQHTGDINKKSTSKKCGYCGTGSHNRSRCPARKDTCQKCGKLGHWQQSVAAPLPQFRRTWVKMNLWRQFYALPHAHLVHVNQE